MVSPPEKMWMFRRGKRCMLKITAVGAAANSLIKIIKKIVRFTSIVWVFFIGYGEKRSLIFNKYGRLIAIFGC